jgi:hypothetical protein
MNRFPGPLFQALAIASLGFLPLLSSCQFKSPTIAEQKYLVEKGAFPGGVPEWLAAPGPGGSLGAGRALSGGLIPQTFTGPAIENSKSAPNVQQASSSGGTFQVPAAIAPQEKKPAEDDKAEKSPLGRIAKLCPSVESEVNEALITIDLLQRIRKYESLVVRCPSSADLWLWLGKDYEKNNQRVKAGRCFEKVLVLDPANQEAEKLLTDNRRALNSKTSDNKNGGAVPRQ